jgi:hypothetical protein
VHLGGAAYGAAYAFGRLGIRWWLSLRLSCITLEALVKESEETGVPLSVLVGQHVEELERQDKERREKERRAAEKLVGDDRGSDEPGKNI